MWEYNGDEFMKRLKEVTGGEKQKDTGKRIGIAQSAVSNFSKSIPSSDILTRLATTYGCSIDYLLGIENKDASDKLTTADVIRCFDYLIRNKLMHVRVVESENPYDDGGDVALVSLDRTLSDLLEMLKNMDETVDAVRKLAPENAETVHDAILEKLTRETKLPRLDCDTPLSEDIDFTFN